jgi:hypothetical protein
MIQLEGVIFFANLTSKPSPQHPIALYFHSVHASQQFFTAYFAGASIGLILVSGVYRTVVI